MMEIMKNKTKIKEYGAPMIDVVFCDTVDVITTSLDWDLPEIPISNDPLNIDL